MLDQAHVCCFMAAVWPCANNMLIDLYRLFSKVRLLITSVGWLYGCICRSVGAQVFPLTCRWLSLAFLCLLLYMAAIDSIGRSCSGHSVHAQLSFIAHLRGVGICGRDLRRADDLAMAINRATHLTLRMTVVGRSESVLADDAMKQRACARRLACLALAAACMPPIVATSTQAHSSAQRRCSCQRSASCRGLRHVVEMGLMRRSMTR